MAELARLAETAGAIVVDRVLQKREAPNPRFYIGGGKTGEVAERVRRHKIDVVLFNNELTPAQVRNLELDLGCKTIDRTELILDIFATHARSRQAKLQVELAQLEYALPRLQKMWTHITSEQQTGRAGIAQRGPGEKQLEVDRRMARHRIAGLHEEIRRIEERKQREVAGRAKGHFTVSLVGYTNAGKSTLMNALTQAGVAVDDKLFSTLDTKTRLWHLKGGLKVLLSDTVGFIRDLPHHLIASFHATLEEAKQADLLLHVVDAGHPAAREQIEAVQSVLRELDCSEKPAWIVLNKIDRLNDALDLHILEAQYPRTIRISALRGQGLEIVDECIARILSEQFQEMRLRIPVTEGKLLAELAASAIVLDQQVDTNHIEMQVRVSRRDAYRLEPFSVPSKISSPHFPSL